MNPLRLPQIPRSKRYKLTLASQYLFEVWSKNISRGPFSPGNIGRTKVQGTRRRASSELEAHHLLMSGGFFSWRSSRGSVGQNELICTMPLGPLSHNKVCRTRNMYESACFNEISAVKSVLRRVYHIMITRYVLAQPVFEIFDVLSSFNPNNNFSLNGTAGLLSPRPLADRLRDSFFATSVLLLEVYHIPHWGSTYL